MRGLNIVVRTLQCDDLITGFEFNATCDEVVPGSVIHTASGFEPRGFATFDLAYIKRFLDSLFGGARVEEHRLTLRLGNCSMALHRRQIIAKLVVANQLPERKLYFWESFRIMSDDGNEVVTQSLAAAWPNLMSLQQ